MEVEGRVRCQRIGCDAMFTEDDNPEDSCAYHESVLYVVLLIEFVFHALASINWVAGAGTYISSGSKCKVGKHTTEKPVPAKPAAAPKPSPVAVPATNASSKDACPRCRQGFFCSEHGPQVKPMNPNPPSATPLTSAKINKGGQEGLPAPAKKIVDINQPQICKNKGCGKTFKEKDNHDTACSYHPGPAVFHDRMRGVRSLPMLYFVYVSHCTNAAFGLWCCGDIHWKCCDIHVKEFDEFMAIEPCTKGWHNADPVS
ncbi:hypothetical protein RHGRI_008403 [Rhododendron griersonianum]|uniref:CHORD domain-containing protein n=1 Tax=Rhododendron griersonianum TaxID=479676 RepID=A0AAV6L296_9ERIC|nr:hypothetical protein RHGRI_008403 [Rhododendron griersonianum]